MADNDTPITQINSNYISLREIFRIIAPGVMTFIAITPAFSPFIWHALGKYPKNWVSLDLGAIEMLILSFVFGVFWYALSLPKRSKLYQSRVNLIKSSIKKIKIDDEFEFDDKSIYDYLINCLINPSAKDRIHYFASIYYMFMDISIIFILFTIINFISLLYIVFINIFFNGYECVYFIVYILLAIMFRRSAIGHLNDVMKFSVFIVAKYRRELEILINSAIKSEEYRNFDKLIKN